MKKAVLLLLVLCLNVYSYADDYKIQQMNISSIKIGNQQCKIGDVFSDTASINWSNYQQAIKAMNLQSRQIRLFIANKFIEAKAKSVRDYYLKSNHLSTRGGVNSFTDLAEELSDTIYLYDIEQIDSPIIMDSLSSYLISYEQSGVKRWRTLMSTERTFFFNRELFGENNNNYYTLTLYFRKKGLNDFIISDNIVIVLLPKELETNIDR